MAKRRVNRTRVRAELIAGKKKKRGKGEKSGSKSDGSAKERGYWNPRDLNCQQGLRPDDNAPSTRNCRGKDISRVIKTTELVAGKGCVNSGCGR